MKLLLFIFLATFTTYSQNLNEFENLDVGIIKKIDAIRDVETAKSIGYEIIKSVFKAYNYSEKDSLKIKDSNDVYIITGILKELKTKPKSGQRGEIILVLNKKNCEIKYLKVASCILSL